ncbi:glycosyltransferase family 4 protein [Maribacter sp. 2308TA10-17]|uniref:glycosyltransferase family 4 protein n=1 Tax=Maribacter sp. 2308TA10-17 TaxID=3386276 RepID=UPI0039BC49B9
MKEKILFGMSPATHLILGLDELAGLEELGYSCSQVTYSRDKLNISTINRMYGVILNAFKVLVQLYKKKPDILYLNSRINVNGSLRDSFSIFLFRYLYFRPLKIIIKSHGSDLSVFERKSFIFSKLVIPIICSKVDAWLFLSQEEVATFNTYKPELKNKAFVTYNIIDPKRSVYSESFQQKHNLPKNKFKFLYVGRMIYEKGVFAILEAIAKFQERENCLFLMVGGNDEELENVKLKVDKLGISDNVRFTGYIKEEECDHFYSNMDALVFPSHDEGFSMTLFKAVAAGLPVITTQIRAAKDQLTAPDNCLWVDGKSGDSVVSALRELYKDEILRNSMRSNNIKLAEKFGRAKVCENIHAIFQKLS